MRTRISPTDFPRCFNPPKEFPERKSHPIYADFTLVELLIVIAIIVILAGLLLPSLNQAWERAKTIKCLTQLQEAYRGGMLYSHDYGGKGFYRMVPDGTTYRTFADLVSQGNTRYLPRNLLVCPKYTCPSNYANDRNKMMFFYTYSFHHFQSVPELRESRNAWYNSGLLSYYILNKIKKPNSFLLLGESAHTREAPLEERRGIPYWYFKLQSEADSTPVRISLHHKSSSNAAFADGHVKQMNLFDFRKLGGTKFVTAELEKID